ncbi:MAG TPA: TonB-dependent receptor plug domain-containing protein [Geothrix sp.]|nr:TonB-dependent receptor plug domain-containing protein [Geothrix sp.]
MHLKPTTKAGFYILLSSLPLILAAQEQVPAPPQDPALSVPTPAPPKPPESWAAESQPVQVGRTPGQVEIFDADDIQRYGSRTLGEFLLREMPGQVQNQGGPGLPSHIYLGGTRPQDTVVLLDGVPLMDPGRLGQDLNEIPLLGITRIEVITGSPSAGPSGQGGTIALFTGKPVKPGASGDLSGLGGNNGQGQSTATPGYAWNGGYFRGGNLSAEEKQTTETDRPYRQVTNFLGLGQKWGSAVISMAWRGTFFGVPQPYQEVTDFARVYNPGRESRQRSDSGLVRIDWGLAPGLGLETTLGMSRFRHEQADDGSALPSFFEGRQTRFQTALHLGMGPRSGLSLRLEAQDTRQDGDEDPLVTASAKGRQIGLGLEWHYEPLPGFRLLGQARSTKDNQSLLQGGMDTSVLSGSGHTLRLGFTQELPFGFRIYGAGGGGRTAPSLIQQLRNSSVPGTAPLRMEQTTFMQVGLGWGKGTWYGKVQAQQQNGKDLIGSNGLAYANQDRLRVRGTDFVFGWRTAKKLGMEAYARTQEARDLNAPAGQQFSTAASQRRPFTAQGLRGLMGGNRVQVEVHYTLQGHQYASFGDCDCAQPIPAVHAIQVVYRDVGMSTTLKIGRHWTLIWRGEHLIQPKVDPAEWVAKAKDGQNDSYIVYGYPAARPTYAFEARFSY